MRGRIAHLYSSLATLTERWGDRCEVVRDLLGGRWSVMRHNGEGSAFLASSKTPEDAVTACPKSPKTSLGRCAASVLIPSSRRSGRRKEKRHDFRA